MHARVVKLSGVAALSSTARHAYRGGSWLAPGQPLAQPTQRRVHVSAVSDTTGVAPRTYTNYSIYKGKAALQVNYVPATFEPYQETSQKQLFALSVTELGTILAAYGHGVTTPPSREFFHDPGKGTPSEGTITKKLTISPLRDGDVIFNLLVKNAEPMSVPVTAAEMEVICAIARFVIPRALGFDRIV